MEPERMPTDQIAKVLKQTRPSRWVSPWVTTAVIGVCITLLSLIANLSLYRWGSDKSNQVETLTVQSDCRSAIAAATDVAQGQMLNDLGSVNLNIARALAKLGQNDDTGVAELVEALGSTSDALEGTLRLYATQLQERAQTADKCASK